MKHCPAMVSCVMLFLALAFAAHATEPSDLAAARATATEFGRALEEASTRGLAAHLPTTGRVRLQLERLVGHERGFFSARQVVTLLRTFLQEGSVDAFHIETAETTAERFVRIDATARITNHKGVTRPAMLRIILELEQGRWVVRELRESGS